MGDTTATVLYTKEDEVMATRDTQREKESSGSSRYTLYKSFSLSIATTSLEMIITLA